MKKVAIKPLLAGLTIGNCAQTTFPDRFIGELRERYEASFITLDGNPLQDWSALARIRYRFKDGRPLLLP